MRKPSYKLDMMICALALTATMVTACDTRSIISSAESTQTSPASARRSADPKKSADEIDHQAKLAMATAKSEAREWLNAKQSNHIVWKWNRAAAFKAVNDVYTAGAKEVWAADIKKTDQDAEMTGIFVIALPEDGAARSKVFAWIALFETNAGVDKEDRTQDAGQKFFLIDTDQ